MTCMAVIFSKDRLMVKIFIFVVSAILFFGCSPAKERVSLEVYHKNKKYVQEYNFSSKNKEDISLQSSDWGVEAFKNRCEWFELERVVDGDTIIVLDVDKAPVRVRMIGIDTPESKKVGTPIEPFALEATEALKRFLEKAVSLCLVEDLVGDKVDTYGRKLSYVFSESGEDINALMLKTGWAEAYTRFPMERTEEFKILEREARKKSVGRWE